MSEIAAIGASGGASTPTPTYENPGATLDRDAFLKLLVAQLKYQDPTNPADTSQMLTQSAQLSMVDRLNELAAAAEASAATQRLTVAGSMVGRQISFVDEEGLEVDAVVDSVRIDADGLVASAGGYEVPSAAIIAIHAAPAAPVPDTATTTLMNTTSTSTDIAP